MIIRSVLAAKVLPLCTIITLSAWLSACNSSDAQRMAANPEDSSQTVECTAVPANACASNRDTVRALPVNTEISGNISRGDMAVFKVPSATQIVLTTVNGDANLYLYDSIDFDNNSLLCAATQPFLEDSCTALTQDNDLYAVVEGHESSEYRISASDDCSVESVNQWIYRNMHDYYLFADQVPTVNTNSYTNPADLVRDLRFEEFDSFSSISDKSDLEAYLNSGKSHGFGFNWRHDANGNARVIFVFPDSSFGRAGIKRGDIIVSVEGELWNEMSSERYFELVGNKNNPRTTNWTFIDGETETSKNVSLTFEEYTVQSVLYSNAYSHEAFSGKVGYLMFNEFLATSESELDVAIQRLKDLGATELILDMRYNPGGYNDIAGKLASQIGGASLNRKTLTRYEYNEKYSDINFQSIFETTAPSLDLNRVVVLTTSSTASASELIINSLRPYLDVVTIGGATRGKAYISSARNFCGLSLNAMEAQGVNASGVSVAGGIQADCYAVDDPTRRFGNQSGEMEGMLQSALDFFVYGTCDVGPSLAKSPAYKVQHTPNIPFMQ